MSWKLIPTACGFLSPMMVSACLWATCIPNDGRRTKLIVVIAIAALVGDRRWLLSISSGLYSDLSSPLDLCAPAGKPGLLHYLPNAAISPAADAVYPQEYSSRCCDH